MKYIGLTGSIGMGKSTVSMIFRSLGVPVFDADIAVHDLYEGEAVDLIAVNFPNSMSEGKIDREKLAAQVLDDEEKIKLLESLVLPLVEMQRKKFLLRAYEKKMPRVVFDIPLLFETGLDSQVDIILVVSTSRVIQRERVLSRNAMTDEKFLKITNRQLPDEEKRRRAHWVVSTNNFIDTRQQIISFLRAYF